FAVFFCFVISASTPALSPLSHTTLFRSFEAVSDGVWDLAFMAVDPRRAEAVEFTEPYVLIEGTYMVNENDPWQSVKEFDREGMRSEEHTSELQSRFDLVCRLLLEKKKTK